MAHNLNPAQLEFRKKFHDTKDKVAAIEAVTGPLRAKRDEFYQTKIAPLEAQRKVMDDEINTKEKGLFDLKNEMAMYVRALNGKTGTTANPDDEPEIEEEIVGEQEADEK